MDLCRVVGYMPLDFLAKALRSSHNSFMPTLIDLKLRESLTPHPRLFTYHFVLLLGSLSNKCPHGFPNELVWEENLSKLNHVDINEYIKFYREAKEIEQEP